MMLGKPIEAVRAGAAAEVPDDAALLAEPEDPDSRAAALDGLLSDEGLRADYGQRVRRRAALFTHEHMMAGYRTVIEALSRA
ncbi:MAG TPA: hypothetical protein VMT34_15015 [Aggregatilineales bacterium]|nr:hypothetical protein [Aggregatilineales bacterium]